VLVGPTASGKTDVVLNLAEKLPIEVISCDSMQAYRRMSVLTQAPSPEVRARAPHHLVEFLEPSEEYSAGIFVERALGAIGAARRAGRTPVVAGGTMLYVTALLDGLFAGPAKDEGVRAELVARAEREGVAALYAELGASDAEAAAKIHPNDLRRIVRALEVMRIAGRKFSEMKLERKGLWGSGEDVRVYGLGVERPILYERINARTARMIEGGAVEEVKALQNQKLSMTAEMCLGVREIRAHLAGTLSLEEASEALKMNTRRYAKRQLSWFGGDDRIRWIRAGADPAKAAAAILDDWQKAAA